MKPNFIRDQLKLTLSGKKILLGVSGSIAAFKACDVVRKLRECGAQVRVVFTDSAQKFVTPVTLETLSGYPVLSSLWENQNASGTHHIDAARWADLVLIAPATANVIGKLAAGIADDLLTTEVLAFQGPVVIAPAMNPMMFAHPAVAANMALLKRRGVRIVGPARGEMACGEEGVGRMSEPMTVVQSVARTFWAPRVGRKVLVTLGPTRSKLDPVRFLTNRSSGLMGASLCWSAARVGFEVVAVCGPLAGSVRLPRGTRRIDVTTAGEMADAVGREWRDAAVFVGTAAVLDWDVSNPQPQKLKKEAGVPTLTFMQNKDILASVSEHKTQGQFVLGFAAETGGALELGYRKLLSKGCDAIFANDVSSTDSGFESPFNRGHWIGADGRVTEFTHAPKIEIAERLMAEVCKAAGAKRETRRAPEATH